MLIPHIYCLFLHGRLGGFQLETTLDTQQCLQLLMYLVDIAYGYKYFHHNSFQTIWSKNLVVNF